MQKLSDVVGIKYRGGYTFHIIFDGRLEGDIDFSGCFEKGPIFEPLKDESFFRQAAIEGGTITWPNGADVAPETLYERIESISRTTS